MSGSIFLESNSYSVREDAGQVGVTFVRTGDTSRAVTINYGINAANATEGLDYRGTAGTAVIAAGATSVRVTIPILNDTLSEPTEQFNVSIISINSGTLLFPRTANVAILDDENPAVDPVDPPRESPYTVSLQTSVAGLSQPVSIEWLPGSTSTALLVEKQGRILVVDTTAGLVRGTLLDISDEVNGAGDRGLMDIALHPDFANQPYLYAFYVVDPTGTAANTGNAGRDGDGNRFAHVVRYEVDTSGALPSIVPGSKTLLLGGAGQTLADISGGGALNFTEDQFRTNRSSEVDPATGRIKRDYIKVDSLSHAGGALTFGPDGALYVAIGDGTSFNYADPRTVNVQNLDSLSGKVLRVDPMTGQGLADNPFVTPGADLGANRSKVYQYGLRNPYTMTFTPDGDLFMSETGWYSYEEINSGPAGANFGWPFYEGGDNGQLVPTPQYSSFAQAASFYQAVAGGSVTVTAPYRAFSRIDSDPGYRFSAIIGSSSIYTGDRYPEVFRNDYFFTNLVGGEVFAVDSNDKTQLQYVTDVGLYGPTNFRQGPDGYMYLVDYDGSRLARLLITDPNVGNRPPVANADPVAVVEDGASVSGSVIANDTDLDGNPLSVTAVGGRSTDVGRAVALASGITVTVRADGSYTVDPGSAYQGLNSGESATERVNYTISDGRGGAASADLVITLAGVTDNGTTSVANDPAFTQYLTGTGVNDEFRIAASLQSYGWGITQDATGTVVWPFAAGGTPDLLFGFEAIRFDDGVVRIDRPGVYRVEPTSGAGITYQDNPAVTQYLTGTSGRDTFVVAARSTDFGWGNTQDGAGLVVWDRRPGATGFDLIYDIEVIRFFDGTIERSGSGFMFTPTGGSTNRSPVAAADSARIVEDGAVVTGSVLVNDGDPDADPIAVTAVDGRGADVGRAVTLASGIAVTIRGDGSYAIAPGTAYQGLDVGEIATERVSYSISDGRGGTATTDLVITLEGRNDRPVVSAFSARTPETAAISGQLSGLDADGEALTFALAGTVPAGVTVTSAGVWRFDPGGRFDSLVAGETATVAFQYTASDGTIASLPATATITIDGVGTPTVNTILNNPAVTQYVTGTSALDEFRIAASLTSYGWGATLDATGTVVWPFSGGTPDLLYSVEAIRFDDGVVRIDAPGVYRVEPLAGAGLTYRDDPAVTQYLTGTSGRDRFVINAPSTAYDWGDTLDGAGTVVWDARTGATGFDLLYAIELIQFTDGTVERSGAGYQFTPNGPDVLI